MNGQPLQPVELSQLSEVNKGVISHCLLSKTNEAQKGSITIVENRNDKDHEGWKVELPYKSKQHESKLLKTNMYDISVLFPDTYNQEVILVT